MSKLIHNISSDKHLPKGKLDKFVTGGAQAVVKRQWSLLETKIVTSSQKSSHYSSLVSNNFSSKMTNSYVVPQVKRKDIQQMMVSVCCC